MIATSRLIGQATGAALVALCFSIAGKHGPALALSLGAAFAGAGSIASGLRLVTRKQSSERIVGDASREA
jgi:DHA2 family multidrug resistance protein-like MFS transporter